MSPSIISVESLSKRYLLGHRFERGELYFYTTLRDTLRRELAKATGFSRMTIVVGKYTFGAWMREHVGVG